MTNVKFYHVEQGWQGFYAKGHSGYADPGEDLVCAAVSVLTQTTLLGLEEIVGIECLEYADDKRGIMLCLLPASLSEEQWQKAQLLLDVLHLGLRKTEEEYGNYVRVKEVPYRENESAILRFQKRRRKF